MGLKPVSTREVVCEDLDDTTLYISEFASCDGNVYTTFVDASYAGHELLRYAVADAWNFVKKFSRNADGTISINGEGRYDGTFAGFNDVTYDAWYAEAVKAVTEAGIVNGKGKQTFAPDALLTRGEMVTILYRNAGSPAVDSAASFPDVAATDFYANAAAWAKAEGLVKGNPDGTFGGKTPISREQFVTILYRLTNPSAGSGSLDAFSDAGTVSAYARSAMEWAVGEGYIKGSGNKLTPRTSIKRSEAVTILYRYLSK